MSIPLKVLGEMVIQRAMESKDTINKVQVMLEDSILESSKVPEPTPGITEEANTTANLVKVWCTINLEESKPKAV